MPGAAIVPVNAGRLKPLYPDRNQSARRQRAVRVMLERIDRADHA
jgi:hypothetical protein